MRIGPGWIVCGALCLWICGCGEFSYKRGGNAGDLGIVRNACRQASQDYATCMQKQGWTVMRMEDLDPVARALPDHDNRRADADIPPPEPVDPSHPPDPMERYTIGSWWKAGGKPEELAPAVAACIDRLGEAHRPPPGSRQATRGLLLCLRERGWIGLQEK